MKALFLSVAICGFSILSGCSIGYLAKQGSYQFRLLAGAEPIERALRSAELPEEKRRKLILITEVRDFCQRNLHLIANKNYKDVNINFDDAVYNVIASKPLAFTPYTWWFPIVGSVPYKGFFDQRDADNEVLRLKRLGYETVKGRVGGYSTLGYFADPIWPSMLEMSDENLVELIIHELTHATFYIPHHTTFNESLANFVGKAGARLFFILKYGGTSSELANLDNNYREQSIKDKFFSGLYESLDNVYKSNVSDEEKLISKNVVLSKAPQEYEALPINQNAKKIDWSRINNAYLLSFRTYNEDETIFAQLLEKTDGNFEQFFVELSKIKGPHPFEDLKRSLDRSN